VSPEAENTSETSTYHRILDAAIRQVGRNGVRGLRVEQVAKDVGVSAPLLYYHFENRSALIRATLDSGTGVMPTGSATVDPGESGREALTRTLLASLADDPEVRLAGVVRSEVVAAAVFDETLQPRVRQHTEMWCHVIEDLVRHAREDGSAEPAVDQHMAARQLVALVDGIRERWLAAVVDLATARAMVEQAVTMLLTAGR
jgi:AcrR family transcriptional regulator